MNIKVTFGPHFKDNLRRSLDYMVEQHRKELEEKKVKEA